MPIWMVAGAAVFGIGCGGTLCDRQQAEAQRMIDKASNCPAVSLTLPSRNACEQMLTICTDADLKIVQQSIDCQALVPACIPGNELSFASSANSCLVILNGLSAPCQAVRTGG